MGDRRRRERLELVQVPTHNRALKVGYFQGVVQCECWTITALDVSGIEYLGLFEDFGGLVRAGDDGGLRYEILIMVED